MISPVNIVEPTLILDSVKCRRNIRLMQEKAARSGVTFRPHFKTHHSAEIGRWFRDRGVRKITVSSVDMALYFARDGWDDITIALVFNILETGKINKLREKVSTVNLTVDSPGTLRSLIKGLEYGVNYFIKVDTGYHRTGILHHDTGSISELIGLSRGSRLRFAGFLTHAGHSYRAGSVTEIRNIYTDTLGKMTALKAEFLEEFPDLEISVGDTPTISVAESLEGADEIRPGNFVFYDLIQLGLGSCSFDDIALVLGAPVISKNDSRREVVVHGGAVHLSKEFITDGRGERIYGRPVRLGPDGWGELLPGSAIVSMSQEHSVIRADETLFNSVAPGDVIGIVPVHSCLAANLAGSYLTTGGVRIPKNRY